MSTVIIGGGDDARHAITVTEQASLGMSDSDRDAAEELFKRFRNDCADLLTKYGVTL